MDVFLRAATLGRGNVPVLPEDVRRIVVAATYPRAVLWCSVCGASVVKRAFDGSFLVANAHGWDDTPRCGGCVGYPHVVIA